MRIVSIQEMKEIENSSINEYGLGPALIDENVGVRGAQFLYETYLKEQHFGEIVVLVGKGNNGADGLSIARHLKNYSLTIRAFLLFNENEGSPTLLKSLSLAKNFGVKISELKNSDQLQAYFSETQEKFFVIDALFGTGVRHPLPVLFSDVISLANKYASIMVSIDIPSGIMGDSGKSVGVSIQADRTLAIGLPKLGHFILTGAAAKGALTVIDAGFPVKLLEGGDKFILSPKQTLPFLLENDRSAYAHKNIFGHVLIIGGSQGLTGSVVLASRAVLRVGAGQVTAVTWEKNYAELMVKADPEMMIGAIPEKEVDQDQLLKTLYRYSSIVIGPGLGKTVEGKILIKKILTQFNGPVILDADAINIFTLKEDGDFIKGRKAPTLLTPHVGEFARFMGIAKEEVLDRPIYWLKNIIDELNCSVLIKSACSYLGLPNGEIYFHDFPNDGMATGGSGNVLSGVLAGILAQNYSEKIHQQKEFTNQVYFYHAICLGLVVHSLAGKHAALEQGRRSMTANSIILNLSKAFFELEKNTI